MSAIGGAGQPRIYGTANGLATVPLRSGGGRIRHLVDEAGNSPQLTCPPGW